MDTEGFISALRRDSAALAAAARDNLDAPVPSCPDWKVTDLVWHTGGVHRHRIWLIGEHPDGPEGFELDDVDDAVVVDWFEEGANTLADLLASSDQDAKVWTWFPPEQNIAFWTRRMAQETTVHRYDAQLAAGATKDIEPAELAADGIDEFLDVFSMFSKDPLPAPGKTIHIHATDAPCERVIRLTEDRPVFEHGHAKGDAALRGSASDLLLALWRRKPLDDVEVFGDRALLERVLAWWDLT
jgi:uncharacterized protein (TIGR03083 family)